MNALREIGTRIRQYESQKGKRPARLEVSVEQLEQAKLELREITRYGQAESGRPGIWFMGVRLVPPGWMARRYG